MLEVLPIYISNNIYIYSYLGGAGIDIELN